MPLYKPATEILLLRLAADAVITNTARDVVFAVTSLAPGTWSFEWEGSYMCALTTYAGRFSATSVGTTTAFQQQTVAGYNTASQHGASSNTNDGTTGVTNAGVAATYFPFRMTGTVVTTAAGAFNFKAGPSAAGTLTMRAGAWARLTRIA